MQHDDFTLIGDGAGDSPDDAMTIATASDATGQVDLFLFNNAVSTVTGSGLRIAAGGAAAVRAVIAENVFDETNTATAGGALVVEHASDAAQAIVDCGWKATGRTTTKAPLICCGNVARR